MNNDNIPFHYLPIGQAIPSELEAAARQVADILEYDRIHGGVCPTCHTKNSEFCSNGYHTQHAIEIREWAEKLADDISKGND